MTIRRVVTGQRSGGSVVLSDGPVPTEHQYAAIPGMMSALVWATGQVPEVDAEETVPTGSPAHPAPGETLLLVVDFPPDSVMGGPDFDPAAAGAEQMKQLPGLAERFEMDNPGMHTTESVDYGIVLDGEVALELDDGSLTALRQGDIVVQQRTRHAWRNSGTAVARVAFVLIGTDKAH